MRSPRGALLWAALAWAVALPGTARAQADTVRLVWTAPGDDGTVGTATAYDLRVSLSTITLSNWSSATPIAGVPAPAPAGARESFVVRGLTQGTTYYFAIRTVDDAGNWSGISNVLRWDWVLDTAPPSAPSGVRSSRPGGDVQLDWNDNVEPDLAGYSVYRSTEPTTGYVRISGSLLSQPQFLDSNLPASANAVYYQVTATDLSGNESARSATVTVQLAAAAGSATLDAPYPNPSSGAVTFPINVAGSGSAGSLEIVDAVGRRVRLLELGVLPAGVQLVVWDGKNESGEALAPGVFRARLVGSDHWVRLVRVP